MRENERKIEINIEKERHSLGKEKNIETETEKKRAKG